MTEIQTDFLYQGLKAPKYVWFFLQALRRYLMWISESTHLPTRGANKQTYPLEASSSDRFASVRQLPVLQTKSITSVVVWEGTDDILDQCLNWFVLEKIVFWKRSVHLILDAFICGETISEERSAYLILKSAMLNFSNSRYSWLCLRSCFISSATPELTQNTST